MSLGSAALNITFGYSPAVGDSFRITARYSGDTNFNTSQASLAQAVNPEVSPGPIAVPPTGSPLEPTIPIGVVLVLLGVLLVSSPVFRRR